MKNAKIGERVRCYQYEGESESGVIDSYDDKYKTSRLVKVNWSGGLSRWEHESVLIRLKLRKRFKLEFEGFIKNIHQAGEGSNFLKSIEFGHCLVSYSQLQEAFKRRGIYKIRITLK